MFKNLAFIALALIVAGCKVSNTAPNFVAPTAVPANKFIAKAGMAHAKNAKYIEVYGHRGARSHAPEHTYSSYKAALEMGVDWADIDISITQDGVIVAYHDMWLNPDILSENGGAYFAKSSQDFLSSIPQGALDAQIQSFLIKNKTFADLQKYEVGLNPNSTYATYFPKQQKIPGARIIRLQDVFDYVNKASNNKIGFQIEIKNTPINPTWTVSPKQFATSLYQLLKKNNLIDRVEVQSFDWQPLYELHKLEPKIKTAFLVGYDDIERLNNSDGSWTGGHLLQRHKYSLPQMVKDLGGSCYEPEDVVLTKADLDEAHRLGLKVVVWTWPEHSGEAFHRKLIAKLISWGVDGIITDDPRKLNSMLKERGYPVPRQYYPK